MGNYKARSVCPDKQKEVDWTWGRATEWPRSRGQGTCFTIHCDLEGTGSSLRTLKEVDLGHLQASF